MSTGVQQCTVAAMCNCEETVNFESLGTKSSFLKDFPLNLQQTTTIIWKTMSSPPLNLITGFFTHTPSSSCNIAPHTHLHMMQGGSLSMWGFNYMSMGYFMKSVILYEIYFLAFYKQWAYARARSWEVQHLSAGNIMIFF